MASRLIVCFGTPRAGLGLYRRLISQLPFVIDQSETIAAVLARPLTGVDAPPALTNALADLLSGVEKKQGVHFLASSQLHLNMACWRNALAANPDLPVHYVFLVRHPYEVAAALDTGIPPLRAFLDWCLAVEQAAGLPHCHLTSTDELLIDPWASLDAFFQTIPDARLSQSSHSVKWRNGVLAEAQPARRAVFATDTGLVDIVCYRIFARLYAVLLQMRLYRPEELRDIVRLLSHVFAGYECPENGILSIANAIVLDQAKSTYISGTSGFELAWVTKSEQNFLTVFETLQPKQVARDVLLKIAEDARKSKQLIGANAIYRFLLLVDPKSPAALTGSALVLNDLKHWGDAYPVWDALFNILEQDGILPSVAQRNSRNACVKALTGDLGYVLSKPIGDVTIFRDHIVQNPGANGHIAFMRTWSYLARTSGTISNAILVNDTRTQTNMGCYTTTNELLRGCQAAGIHVDHTITLIELSLLADQLFSRGTLESYGNFEDFLSRFVSRPEFHAYRKLLAKHRVLIVNGEGSFYDRQRKGLILCILIVYAKRFCGSIVHCINHSADLHDDLMRRWVYQAYLSCDTIAVREHLSLSRLPEEFRCFDVRLVPDAAYAVVDHAETASVDLFLGADQLFARPVRQPYVVVSGTSSIFRGDREGFFNHHVLAFNSLLCAIMAKGFKVVLLVSDNTDYKLLRQAAIEFDLPLVSPTAPVEAVLTLFRDATAFISGRWHTSIIAACAGCPSILGDANFFKTSALHESYRYPWPMFDYRNLENDNAKILLAIEHCQNEGLRRQVLSEARASAKLVAQSLHAFIAGCSPPT
jgi:hypothetical protein